MERSAFPYSKSKKIFQHTLLQTLPHCTLKCTLSHHVGRRGARHTIFLTKCPVAQNYACEKKTLYNAHYIILKYQLVQTLYPAALPFSIIFMIKQSYQGFHVFSYSLIILFIPTNNKIYSKVSIVFKENVVQVNVSKLTMLIMKERNLS